MFTALRWFSILITMMAEHYLLEMMPSSPVQISVYLMVSGAMVAAYSDLAFSLKANGFP